MAANEHADAARPSGCGASHGGGHHDHHRHNGAEGKVKDPVCGMSVDPLTAEHRAEHSGQPFYFCSAGCRAKFIAAPEKYLSARKPPAEAPAGAIYTCPMHPEIRKAGPGACPICGMALEPETVSLDAAPNPE